MSVKEDHENDTREEVSSNRQGEPEVEEEEDCLQSLSPRAPLASLEETDSEMEDPKTNRIELIMETALKMADIGTEKKVQDLPKSILKKKTGNTDKKPKKVELIVEGDSDNTKSTQTQKDEDVRYEISVKEEIFMTVVVKNGEVTKFEKTSIPGADLGEALALKLRDLKRISPSSSSEGSVDEEKDLVREKDLKVEEESAGSDSEQFEDCRDYDEVDEEYLDEATTDFGCGGYYLGTIEEEEEEELEQFEQLEQLCSSDDFDPDDLLREGGTDSDAYSPVLSLRGYKDFKKSIGGTSTQREHSSSSDDCDTLEDEKKGEQEEEGYKSYDRYMKFKQELEHSDLSLVKDEGRTTEENIGQDTPRNEELFLQFSRENHESGNNKVEEKKVFDGTVEKEDNVKMGERCSDLKNVDNTNKDSQGNGSYDPGERIQSFRQYKKFKEATGSPPAGYTNRLEMAKDSKSGCKIRSVSEAAAPGSIVGERLRREQPGIDSRPERQKWPAGADDIFGRGYDFESDRWFADRTMRQKREEETLAGTGGVKPALKRAAPGKSKKKKNKVQFDESLNSFYESDYVIIIREEGECEGEGCICGGAYYYEEDYDDEEDLDEHQEVEMPQVPAHFTTELCCSPAYFDPPVEFVDQLTLSPPDGYKDLNIGTEQDEKEDTWGEQQCGGFELKEAPTVEDNTTQTTPTSDVENNVTDNQGKSENSYIVETITMTTVTERRIVHEGELVDGGVLSEAREEPQAERQEAAGQPHEEAGAATPPPARTHQRIPDRAEEMTLTFRLGNIMTANSLKPNSAVRQLFPSPRFVSPPPARSPEDDPSGKKSPESDEDDGLQNNLIKRTIERNTLRRSMLRYPADIRLKRNRDKFKNDNSLVERIKKLTCDLDDDTDNDGEKRTSPTGQEAQEPRETITTPILDLPGLMTTTQHSYRRISDLYGRKEPHPVVLQAPVSIDHQYPYYRPVYTTTTPVPPDLGNGGAPLLLPPLHLTPPPPLPLHHPAPPPPPPASSKPPHPPPAARTSVTAEARKQFLSSLAPLAACVSANKEDARDMLVAAGNRESTASSSAATDNTEYSLDDIDDALKGDGAPVPKPHQPDVVAGTPGNEHAADELAAFVQQDASRIERLRKRYSSSPASEPDDVPYGQHQEAAFGRRPSVRGIKPRFGSTTEILQQMQSQMTPPLLAGSGGSHVSWPYYTDAGKMSPNMNGYHRRPQQLLQYAEEAAGGPAHYQQAGAMAGGLRGPVQLHLVAAKQQCAGPLGVVPPQRQVVVRGTQTISTSYYQLGPGPCPGLAPARGPLLYYPAPGAAVPMPGSPTKMKLERGTPEGASSSPALHHPEHSSSSSSPSPLTLPPPDTTGALEQHNTMMYAMNV